MLRFCLWVTTWPGRPERLRSPERFALQPRFSPLPGQEATEAADARTQPWS